MPSTLVDTTFSTGPKDELAVVDVYKETNSEVINSFQEQDSTAIDAADQSVEADATEIDPEAQNNAADPLADYQATVDAADYNDFVDNYPDYSEMQDAGKLASESMGDLGGINSSNSLSEDLDPIKGALGGDAAAATDQICRRGDKFAEASGFSLKNIKSLASTGVKYAKLAASLASGNLTQLAALTGLPKEMQGLIIAGKNPAALLSQGLALGKNGVNTLAAGTDPDTARAVASLANTINPGASLSIKNPNGTAALVAGATIMSNSMNFPNPFGGLAESLGTDSKEVKEATKTVAQYAAATGDLALLRNVVGSSKDTDRVLDSIPGLAQAMVANTKKPVGLSQQEYPEYYTNMKATLDSTSPNWSVYSRGGEDAVNAAVIGQNPFMTDLMRSQMNTLMKPTNYLTKAQTAFPSSSAYDSSSAVKAVNVSTITVPGTAVSSDGVTPVDEAGYESSGDPAVTAAMLQRDVTLSNGQVLNFDNEPFMMLGSVYPDKTVADDLGKHFPEFTSAMSGDIQELTTFA